MLFPGVREVTTCSTSSSPTWSTSTSCASSLTTSTVWNNFENCDKESGMFNPQIILPAAWARSRSTPSTTWRRCRSWTKPLTSLASSEFKSDHLPQHHLLNNLKQKSSKVGRKDRCVPCDFLLHGALPARVPGVWQKRTRKYTSGKKDEKKYVWQKRREKIQKAK